MNKEKIKCNELNVRRWILIVLALVEDNIQVDRISFPCGMMMRILKKAACYIVLHMNAY